MVWLGIIIIYYISLEIQKERTNLLHFVICMFNKFLLISYCVQGFILGTLERYKNQSDKYCDPKILSAQSGSQVMSQAFN